LNFEQNRKQVLHACLKEIVLRNIKNPLLIEMIEGNSNNEHTMQKRKLSV